MQAKLLQVLQDRELYRVGGTKPVRLDIRIIAATNQNLDEMVSEGNLPEGSVLPPQCCAY